jgi:hypothetical protein
LDWLGAEKPPSPGWVCKEQIKKMWDMLGSRNVKNQMRAYLFLHAAGFFNMLAKGD